MKADFHVHTKASDGDFDLIELIKRAKENNLTHIAITDHDVYDIVDVDITEAARSLCSHLYGVAV